MTRSHTIKLLQDKAEAHPELCQGELVKKAVADALEEAANSLYAQITWSDDSDDKTAIINETLLEATRQIRALIKCNAVKEGE